MKNTTFNLRISQNAKTCLTEIADYNNLSHYIFLCILDDLILKYPNVPRQMLQGIINGQYNCINDFIKDCEAYNIDYKGVK